MATYAETTDTDYGGFSELTPQRFAQARKQMLLQGFVDIYLFEQASPQQKMILHQIELTVRSVTESDEY